MSSESWSYLRESLPPKVCPYGETHFKFCFCFFREITQSTETDIMNVLDNHTPDGNGTKSTPSCVTEVTLDKSSSAGNDSFTPTLSGVKADKLDNHASNLDVTEDKLDIQDQKQDVQDISCQEGEVDGMEPKHPENFLDLVEMLQKGLKLPGTEELDIQPLNVDPTPGNRERPLKPWEMVS